MSKGKQQVVTFKADAELVDAISHIPNRSEFIRTAVLSALDSTCPLCNGTGILNVRQKQHWDEFMRDHRLKECRDCHEMHLVCRRAARGRSKEGKA